MEQMEAAREEFKQVFAHVYLENRSLIRAICEGVPNKSDVELWRQLCWTTFKKAKNL